MSEDFRTKSQLREDRLEREHNDPEFIPQEECRHCDDLTEPNPKEGKECGECYNPYGLNEDETHEYHQNQISDLEKKNKEQAAKIAVLKHEFSNVVLLARVLSAGVGGLGSEKIGAIREKLAGNNDTYHKIFKDAYPLWTNCERCSCEITGTDREYAQMFRLDGESPFDNKCRECWKETNTKK